MQIALLADIHGNLAALEAVLAELDRLRPDRIAVLGDIVDGAPDSLACWERVRGLGAVVLRGNHERYVVDYGTERAAPEWSTPQFAPVRWTVAQCREVKAELAALRVACAGGGRGRESLCQGLVHDLDLLGLGLGSSR